MDTDSREKRLEMAVKHLISLGEIDSNATVKSIAKRMNRRYNGISSAMNGDNKYLTQKFTKSFCAVYGNVISAEWIWSGDGTMLNNNKDEFKPTMKRLPSDLDDKTRPRLPVTAAAGHLSEYIDGVMMYECEQMPIIRRFPNYDFTIIIRGNSMEPKYEGGDEIALRKSTILEWGKDYVLDTEAGVVFKKIYDAGENIRCVSYNNDEYPDFLVPKSAIYGYYKFVGLIRI